MNDHQRQEGFPCGPPVVDNSPDTPTITRPTATTTRTDSVDVAGLQAPHAAAEALGRRSPRVDRAVDDVGVEQPVSQATRRVTDAEPLTMPSMTTRSNHARPGQQQRAATNVAS
jgi:hypothetical protein